MSCGRGCRMLCSLVSPYNLLSHFIIAKLLDQSLQNWDVGGLMFNTHSRTHTHSHTHALTHKHARTSTHARHTKNTLVHVLTHTHVHTHTRTYTQSTLDLLVFFTFWRSCLYDNFSAHNNHR